MASDQEEDLDWDMELGDDSEDEMPSAITASPPKKSSGIVNNPSPRHKIIANASKILNKPGKWDVFLNHTQRHPAAAAIAVDLYSSLKELGLSVWLDVKMDKKSEAAMKEGVVNSKCVIAIITGVTPDGNADNAYFNRPFCIKELEWAMEAEVQIQPVIRMEDKNQIGTFLGQAPAHLKCLGSIDFIDLNRSDKAYWQVGVNKIMEALQETNQTLQQSSGSGSGSQQETTSVDPDPLSNELVGFLTAAKIKVTDKLTAAFNELGIEDADDLDELDEEMTGTLEGAMKAMAKASPQLALQCQ